MHLPSELFAAMPCVMTVIALVLISTGMAKRPAGMPAALGEPYTCDDG